MSKLIDSVIVFRILKKLTTPWHKMDAYKAGVIDKKGNLLVRKKDQTREQKKSYTMLDRLVINLKRLLAKVPGGNTQFGSYLAAVALLKEYVEQEANKETAEVLVEKLEEHNIIPAQKHDLSTVEGYLDAWEDALIEGMASGASFGGSLSGANSNADANATGLAGVDRPLKKKRRVEKILDKRL